MRKILTVLFTTFLFLSCESQVLDTSFNQINTKLKHASLRLKQKVIEAKNYVVPNGFNESIVFLIDMSIPSGKKRFFVYNLKKDSIETSSLVAHGAGSDVGSDVLVFSNKVNSNATSLGRYKIGSSYFGLFGLSYRLYGLDSSNSNAFIRKVVLHSHKAVTDTECYPYHVGFESAGCPTVSPSFLKILTKYIANSTKPILLHIYN